MEIVLISLLAAINPFRVIVWLTQSASYKENTLSANKQSLLEYRSEIDFRACCLLWVCQDLSLFNGLISTPSCIVLNQIYK